VYSNCDRFLRENAQNALDPAEVSYSDHPDVIAVFKGAYS